MADLTYEITEEKSLVEAKEELNEEQLKIYLDSYLPKYLNNWKENTLNIKTISTSNYTIETPEGFAFIMSSTMNLTIKTIEGIRVSGTYVKYTSPYTGAFQLDSNDSTTINAGGYGVFIFLIWGSLNS